MGYQFWRMFYTILFYLTIPFVLIRMLWRSRKAPLYAKRWSERFAFFECPSDKKNGIWVHAVSIGEFMAAKPLIRAIQNLYPNISIVVTTTTPTGSICVKDSFGQDVFHIYAPFDLPGAWRRFLKKIQPKVVIILETELWPNMLYHCERKKIPVLMANARLSRKSYEGYASFQTLSKRMLRQVSFVGTQSNVDLEHYLRLGLPKEKGSVFGNLKFDVAIPQSAKEIGQRLRETWGRHRPVFIAGSTHAGEEVQILDVFVEVRRFFPSCLLILVPRHPERFEQIIQLCQRRGFSVGRRSQSETNNPTIDLFVGDTMGELAYFYAASDVAFVGGSLVPVGGHNVLEPCGLGIPTLVGPYTHNFKEITESLVAKGGCFCVEDKIELTDRILDLFSDDKIRLAMGEHALEFVEGHRGSVEAHLFCLQKFLEATNFS